MTRCQQPATRRRRLAAAAMAVGLSGAAFAGLGVAMVPSADASAPSAGIAKAAPVDTSASSAPSADPATTAASPAAPTTPAATPTTAAASSAPATPVASSAPVTPIFGSPVASKKPTAAASPTVRSTSKVTAHPTATPRATSTARYVAPVTTYTAAPVYGGNASADLPTDVGATGSPSAVETVKPSTSASPVYAEAQTGVVSKRKYIDVQGLSVDAILGYIAAAGALIGVIGGAGLWFTRGVR